MKNKHIDLILGSLFMIFTALFIIIALNNSSFFHWVFARHQNQLSWYIRPLFLIPYCFFAYKKSLTGIGATIFLLFTSMFWFPVPQNVSPMVSSFLQMEMEYLQGNWDLTRFLFTLVIPVTLTGLAYVIWKRDIFGGICVLIFMAFIKIIWSLLEGGESGLSIIIPAIIGLAVCIGFLYAGYVFLQKRKGEEK
ncbi:hypothetical protein [Spirochaeta cellobiosiphila]|uniref:hypothetical protein n=1 Tax=Spirochaeta cellobiosiphila TaxID=504483 RepID=UPI0003FA6AF0|nr:hypothetical protein [Spirochaeta cellobiosiphila]